MNIVDSIRKEPHKWRQRGYTFDHDDGLRIWTGNGLPFINTYPEGIMSITMKIRIWLAIRWWTSNQPVSRDLY